MCGVIVLGIDLILLIWGGIEMILFWYELKDGCLDKFGVGGWLYCGLNFGCLGMLCIEFVWVVMFGVWMMDFCWIGI